MMRDVTDDFQHRDPGYERDYLGLEEATPSRIQAVVRFFADRPLHQIIAVLATVGMAYIGGRVAGGSNLSTSGLTGSIVIAGMLLALVLVCIFVELVHGTKTCQNKEKPP